MGTRRLSIETHSDETVIRYQWCPTLVRYALSLFLVIAVVILVTEHGGKALSVRIAIELVWAAMVLGLILILTINMTEVRVTAEEVQVRCIPVGIYPLRTLRRVEIVSIHHWVHWIKNIQYRLAIQLAFPVQLGAFETRDEARIAAEAIARRLQVDCRESRPNRRFDMTYIGSLLRIVACLAAPLMMLLLLD